MFNIKMKTIKELGKMKATTSMATGYLHALQDILELIDELSVSPMMLYDQMEVIDVKKLKARIVGAKA